MYNLYSFLLIDIFSDNSNNENNCESGSNDNENSNETSLFCNKKHEQIKCSTFPVAIPNDIFITSQRLKNNRTIYTRYVPSLNHLMVNIILNYYIIVCSILLTKFYIGVCIFLDS